MSRRTISIFATLEILEESLLEYTGALVLVTHDRYMLDRVSTIVLGLDGKGGAERFCGLRAVGAVARREGARRSSRRSLREPQARRLSAAAAAASNGSGKKKLSYLEAREYAGIEAAVEAAEDRLQAARDRMEDPAVVTDADKLTAALAEMEAAQDAADDALCAVGGADGEGGSVSSDSAACRGVRYAAGP